MGIRFKGLAGKLVFAILGTTSLAILAGSIFLTSYISSWLENSLLQRVIITTKNGAQVMGTILTESFADKAFDFELVEIPFSQDILAKYKNKDIDFVRKYHYKNGLDTHLEPIIQPLEDLLLKDHTITYAVLMDRNGYIPVHNSKFSKALTGDYDWDNQNSRAKRIFLDPISVNGFKNTKLEVLKQTRKRDTGEMIWDLSYPVFVKGEHWGTYRIGISLKHYHEFIFFVRLQLMAFMVVLLAILGGLTYWVTRKLLAPLRGLHTGAKQIAAGNLKHQIPVESKDEIGDLVADFNKMAVDLDEHIHQLTETTRTKERMESELNIAKRIQMNLLPKDFPDLPEFSIHAVLEPAREVGGDLYDCFFVDKTNLCVVIGDVSDKGVPAALFMAMTQMLIKRCAKETKEPENILQKVNEELAANNKDCMFVTLFLGILNTKNGEMRYANAGHPAPLIIKNKCKEIKIENGSPLGVFEDKKFPGGILKLEPGEMLLLYTDGVTEAFNRKEEMFGLDRLKKAIKNEAPGIGVKNILRSVKKFAGKAEQSDDITILAVKRYEAKRFVVKTDFDKVLQNFKDTNLLLVLDEVLSNVIKYGKAKKIAVEIFEKEEEFVVIFEDDGKAFDLRKSKEPNFKIRLKNREIGGLGIHLVKQLAKRIEYERIGGKNRLQLAMNKVK